MADLRKWEPFAGPTGLPDLWSDMLSSSLFGPRPMSGWEPRIEVNESSDAYEITAEVPGVPPEEVNITLDQNTLTISGEKKEEERRDEDQVHFRERRYGAFSRSLSFPTNVDEEQIDAENVNGVLRIRVPKSQAAQPRQIAVRAGGGGASQQGAGATEGQQAQQPAEGSQRGKSKKG